MRFMHKLLFTITVALALVACSKSNDPTIKTTTPLPKISINDATGAEGSSLTFTVTLSEISSDTVKFSYQTQNGSATAADYTTVSVPMVAKINPGQTTTIISISAKTDALNESDETFNVELSNAKNCDIVDGEGIGTITNVTAITYFFKAKINGVQWNAIIGGFFGAEVIGNVIGTYGTDGDSQLSFIFYNDPTGPKTYGMEELGATSDANISVYYTPHFFSSGGAGTTWNGQPGGTFVFTSFNTSTKIAEGTFSFTGKASNGTTVQITEGSFKIPIN